MPLRGTFEYENRVEFLCSADTEVVIFLML